MYLILNEIQCCCTASTKTTSTVAGAVATLLSASACETQSEILKRSE